MGYSQSEVSSTAPSVVTPSSSELTTIGNLRLQDDPSDAVPWPGNTYNIIEESTGRLLTVSVNLNISAIDYIKAATLCLRATDYGPSPTDSWLCVEAEGYFGFFHPFSNMYLSVQEPGKSLSPSFGPEQYYIPRRHPNGGYQLLSPAGSNTLKQLAVISRSYENQFLRRQHAGAIWRFSRVSTGDD
ncbi:hypothetical protein HDV57DRAFT_499015 [Trichoderma longibrachiatum]